MKIPYFLSTERVVGSGHPSLSDTINRGLRQLLTLSGFNPDGDFTGFNARRNPVGDGADATGVADSSSAIALAHTNSTSAGLEFFPGSYKIAGTVAITKPVKMHDGAMFVLAAGGALTLNPKLISAGPWKIFDTTGGGTVSFSKQATLRLEHWGVVGDGVADDGPAWNRMFASVIDAGLVEVTPGLRMRFATTVNIPRRADWTISSPSSALVTNQTPSIFWDGAYGGRCFNVWRSSNIHFEGIRIETITQGTTVRFDGSANTASPNTISLLVDSPYSGAGVNGPEVGRGIVIFGAGANGDPLLAHVTASPSSNSLTIDTPIQTTVSPTRVYLGPIGTTGFPGATAIDFCGDPNGLDFLFGLSITSGQKRVTVADQPHPTWYHGKRNVVYPDMVNRTVHIPGAGPAGGVLTTTIATVIDGITFTVANAASTTVSSVTGTAEPMTGIGASGASNIGTQPSVRRMSLFAHTIHPRVEQVRVSADALSNWEFGSFRDNQFYGGDGSANVPLPNNVTIAGGSLNQATSNLGGSAPWSFTNPVGLRVRIEGAGVAGTVYDGLITAYNAGTSTVTLSPAASTAVTNAFALVGEYESLGFYLGQSANAHGHKLFRNFFSNVGVWIYAINGGFDSDAAQGAGAQYCFYVTQSSRMLRVFNTVVQDVGTFFAGGNSIFGVELKGNNVGDCGMVPNTPGGVAAAVVSAFGLANNSWDTTGIDGVHRKMWDHSAITSGYWHEENSVFSGTGSPMTMAQLGYTPNTSAIFPFYYRLKQLTGCSDIKAAEVIFGLGDLPALRTEVSSAGSTGFAQVRGITSIARTSADPTEARGIVGKMSSRLDAFSVDSTLTVNDAGVEGQVSVDFGPIEHPVAAVQGQIRWEPSSFNNSVNANTPYHVFRGRAPVFLNGGGSLPIVPQIYGLRLEEQWQDNTHTPDVRALWQESSHEKNWLAGSTKFGDTANTPITNLQVYAPTLTPVSVAAGIVQEETFTVTGLATTDKVIVNPPAIGNACMMCYARVSAINTLAIGFVNPTAGALTPVSGVYSIIAIRS